MKRITQITMLAGCLLAPVFADEYEPANGTVELSGMGGLNIGPTDLGNHPTIIGDMQGFVNRWFSVGAGAGWAPITNTSFGYGVAVNANLYSYNGGLQFHIANSSRITPYLTVGAGGIRMSAKATLGGVKYFGASDSAFAGNFGAGFRVYVTRRFGVRFEATAFKGRDTNLFGRAVVGVFGQFGGH